MSSSYSPVLLGYTSECILQNGADHPMLSPVGLQNLVYTDGRQLLTQVYDEAARLVDYRAFPGLTSDRLHFVEDGHAGGKRGDPAEFCVLTLHPDGPEAQIGPFDTVAAAILAPSFAVTRAALDLRPLERLRVAQFVSDAVGYAMYSKDRLDFTPSHHLLALRQWDNVLEECCRLYPHLRGSGARQSFVAPSRAPSFGTSFGLN